MADSISGYPDPRPADDGPAKADPFETLFKMSKTAGLGSADYVAINGTSIAAILVGILSALVLFNVVFLLLIPIIGVILAFLALKQIRNSNGTQTGAWLAIGGLLLSLGFGGFTAVAQGREMSRNRQDTATVGTAITRLGQDVFTENFDDGYKLFNERFRSRVPIEMFSQRFKQANAIPMFGKITSLGATEIVKFDEDQVTGDRVCSALAKVSYEKVSGTERLPMVFRQGDGQWLIDDIPNLFPTEKPQQGAGAPPAQAGPPKPTP